MSSEFKKISLSHFSSIAKRSSTSGSQWILFQPSKMKFQSSVCPNNHTILCASFWCNLLNCGDKAFVASSMLVDFSRKKFSHKHYSKYAIACQAVNAAFNLDIVTIRTVEQPNRIGIQRVISAFGHGCSKCMRYLFII